MSEEIRVDAKLFESRLNGVFSRWTEESDSLIILTGRRSDEVNELKSLAMHNYLFGVELTDTVLVFDRSQSVLRVLASSKKLSLLRSLPKTRLLSRPEDSAQNPQSFTDLLSGLSRPVCLRKETHSGEFASQFTAFEQARFPEAGPGAALVSEVLTVQDETALEVTKRAAQLTTALLKSGLIRQVEESIEQGEKVTHKRLVQTLEKTLDNKDFQKKLSKFSVDPDLSDLVYSLVQSGEGFNLRPDAQTDAEKLNNRCVVLAVGAKFKEHHANCVRTLLVDPDEFTVKVYEAVNKTIDRAVAMLRPGRVIAEFYTELHASLVAALQEVGVANVAGITKDFGSCIGLEFRDSNNLINAKNSRTVVVNSVFNVAVGVADLVDSKNRKFAVWLADTVLVGGSQNSVFTAGVSRAKDEISYSLEDEEEETKEEVKDRKERKERKEEQEEAPTIRRVGGRRRGAEEEEAERKKLAERQEELRRQKAEDIKQRYAEQGAEQGDAQEGSSSSPNVKRFDEYVTSYRDPAQLDRYNKKQVHLDMKSGSLLIPISGELVPFHVRLIKTVTKPEDANARVSQLRIAFHTPNLGGFGGGGVDAALFPRIGGRSVYVKEISVQAEDGKNLSAVFRGIKEAQKKMKEEDTKEEVSKEQVSLKLTRDRPRPVLRDLNIKPQTGPQGRSKAVGVLEGHENGFRFTGGKSEVVDIIYKNIEHAIFQPCETKDNVVLLHFRLKDAIMVGKKKTQDIQFYTETRSAGDDLNQRRRAGYDPDEILEEQREREMIGKINKLFKDFVKKVEEEQGRKIEFDMPYRELGFHGTPGKSNVDIYPCQNCLVALNEWPAFVYSLKNVEIVYFERISYGLKNFDMVFVDKDLTKLGTRISAIPTTQVEQIKAWLSEIEIVFYEGPTNLNWPNILKELAKDKKGFAEAGGWHSYFADEEGDEEDDDEEDDSDFSDASDDESEEGSDLSDDSDASSLASEDDDSDASVASEEDEASEGLSWDDLEKKAAKEDKKRSRDDSDDDKHRSHKKRK